MSLNRARAKISLYKSRSAKDELFTTDAFPLDIDTIGEALTYISRVILPNAKPAVPTEGDLPSSGNELYDYRIVVDYNNTGKNAGFRWYTKEGQTTPEWNLVELRSSTDSILEQWKLNAAGIFAEKDGSPGGQTLHGSNAANEDLTLSPNSGDGSLAPRDQTGFINLFGHTRPLHHNAYDLGTPLEMFSSLYLRNNLSDGTSSVTIAQMLAAYIHSQATGNPHSTHWTDILSRLGVVTIDGDVDSVSEDFSIGGNKTFTLNVKDNSHNHEASNITDLENAIYLKVKAILNDGPNIAYSKNDGSESITPSVSVSTDNITDIPSAAKDKILVGLNDGSGWRQSNGRILLSGNISGDAVFNSQNDQWEIVTTTNNTPLSSVDRINLESLAFTSTISNPCEITMPNHGMKSGRKIRITGSSNLDAEHVITIVDVNTFTIPVDATQIDSGFVIPDGSQFLYNSLSDVFEVKLNNAELSHHELSNLFSDDHTQYNKVAGRGDGSLNKVTGGELANGNLYLRSTSDSSRGDIRIEDSIKPETSASYSGGWQGVDIGGDTRRLRNIYLSGSIHGLKPEEVSSLPVPTTQEKHRIITLPNGTIWKNTDGTKYQQLMVMPDLTGQKGMAMVVKEDETGFDFTEVRVLSKESQPGTLTGITNSSVKTIPAPTNAIGIHIQINESNSDFIRLSWGTQNPTPTSGLKMLTGEREYFDVTTDIKVIAEGSGSNSINYTWSIR